MARCGLSLCFLLLSLLKLGYSARILVAMSIPSFSHQNTYRALWKELSLRGHQVTAMTPDIINDTNLINLTEINWHGAYDVMLQKTHFKDVYQTTGIYRAIALPKTLCGISKLLTEYEMSVPEVKELVFSKDSHFDLVIVEYLSPFMLAFAARFDCPAIGLTSMDGYYVMHDVMGNPTHPVLYPNFDMSFSADLALSERLLNVIYSITVRYFIYSSEKCGIDYQKLFNLKKAITTTDTLSYMKLAFINANPIFFNTRPLSPGTINIGGWSHLQQERPLPRDLKLFLDQATDGVIYFSLGTNIHSSDLSDNTTKVFYEVLSELPYNVLWKIDPNQLPQKASNIRASKWFPQQDVLRHPNMKLFVTQCGLQSMEEAIYNHVPLVGMPIFGDQFNNAMKMEEKGFGVRLDYNKLNKVMLKGAILEAINNRKYKDRAKQLAGLILDQPIGPIEKALWWTEYLIRHRNEDLSHLKGQKIELYKYFLLDIIALGVAVLGVLILLVVLTLLFIKRILRAVLSTSKVKTS